MLTSYLLTSYLLRARCLQCPQATTTLHECHRATAATGARPGGTWGNMQHKCWCCWQGCLLHMAANVAPSHHMWLAATAALPQAQCRSPAGDHRLQLTGACGRCSQVWCGVVGHTRLIVWLRLGCPNRRSFLCFQPDSGMQMIAKRCEIETGHDNRQSRLSLS